MSETKSFIELISLSVKCSAIGMGVVFISLFLMTIVLHEFKSVLAFIEKKSAPTPGDVPSAGVSPDPDQPPEPMVDCLDEGALAAAIAVGLHLKGALGRPPVVSAGEATGAEASGWRLAGRINAASSLGFRR